jgi:hypothetical protein
MASTSGAATIRGRELMSSSNVPPRRRSVQSAGTATAMLPLLSTTVAAPARTEPCSNASGTTPTGVTGAGSVVAGYVEPATRAIDSRIEFAERSSDVSWISARMVNELSGGRVSPPAQPFHSSTSPAKRPLSNGSVPSDEQLSL